MSFHGSCRGSRLLTILMFLPFTLMLESSTILHTYDAKLSNCTESGALRNSFDLSETSRVGGTQTRGLT